MREQKIMRLRLRFCYMQKSNEKKPILFFITFFLHQNNTFYSKKLKYKECMEIVILVLVQFREFFPALWQLEILIRISRTFWNIGLKKFPHFLTFGILQYEFPAFFSFGVFWVSRTFSLCLSKVRGNSNWNSTKYKKCGKFKLKFPNVKKCGKIQITRTLKQVSHFLHFLYFSTFYYFCNVFQRNTLKKNGRKNKKQTEYMHIMVYF